MQHNTSIHIIRKLTGRWRKWLWVTQFVWAVAILLPVAAVLYMFNPAAWIWFLVLAGGFFKVGFLAEGAWKINENDVASFLDKTEPSLEESTHLLLTEQQQLLPLMQADKTAAALEQLPLPEPWLPKLKKGFLFLGLSVIVTIALSYIKPGGDKQNSDAATTQSLPEKKPEGVTTVSVHITPPAYTGKKQREQKQFGITAEEGSTVAWTVHTTHPAKQLFFVFNDSLKMPLLADKEHTTWTFSQKIVHPGFYQLLVDTVASDLYRLDMVRDESPAIVIHQPKPNTVIDYGMPRRSELRVAVTDDYGVQDVWIMATISSGRGEGVKFREEQLRFANTFTGQVPLYNLQRTLDLNALKMSPGDELYFYILAKDNAGHEKRSDISIITIADTAQLMSMSDLTLGVNAKPDYFRSQRQIIIETEQLLRDKDTISLQRFKDRSNNLGIDQKLLRMRYGKFLGEENNLDGGENDGHEGDHEGEMSDAASMLDAVTHKHDIAEDATFFTPETKALLKATLAEMWNAELRLRTFNPQEALPYEYKALRLLKELQQKDRVYVAKTTIKTAPLKPEKRLTADLSKILQPVWQQTLTLSSTETVEIRNAIGELEQYKQPHNTSSIITSGTALTTAYKQLSNAAAASPSAYLPALESMKHLQEALRRQTNPEIKDVTQIQKALQQLVAPEETKPHRSSIPMQQPGYDYFKQLQKQRRQ